MSDQELIALHAEIAKQYDEETAQEVVWRYLEHQKRAHEGHPGYEPIRDPVRWARKWAFGRRKAERRAAARRIALDEALRDEGGEHALGLVQDATQHERVEALEAVRHAPARLLADAAGHDARELSRQDRYHLRQRLRRHAFVGRTNRPRACRRCGLGQTNEVHRDTA